MVNIEQLKETDRVVASFRKYLETFDKALIIGLPNDILEKTLNIYASSRGDKESGWYRAIERRLSELNEQKKQISTKKGKWIDRGITFLLGLLSGVILLYIGYKFFST